MLESGLSNVLVSTINTSLNYFRISLRSPVNGIEKGQGVGGNKQIAKEQAARAAYYAMGWT